MHQLAETPLHPNLLETSRSWFSPLTEDVWAEEDLEMSKATENSLAVRNARTEPLLQECICIWISHHAPSAIPGSGLKEQLLQLQLNIYAMI